LTIFGYFTAVGLLFFGYRYLEHVATRDNVSPLDPLTNELFTGAWMAALLFPPIARFARRFPIDRSNWMRRAPRIWIAWASSAKNAEYEIFGPTVA
jgi:hypothetical protein